MVGVGQTLDKYELIEKVGQGGMAVVYRGLDTTLRREVAVKVLHHHLAEHKEARDRFEREAHAVAKLRHENILEIFAFSGNESPESYIVMEFIEGQTLKDFIEGHEIRFPEVGAMIAMQVCRALVHAHGLGVLHRDVKPENIMIRSDGVVKLTDFGIAQMIDLQRMTVTGQLLGSPAYMAPEHVEGGQLDFRTDVFAVGIVLYQLVCGVLPFRGKNPHEILKKIAECRYRDPELINPRVGSELAAIIRKALARLPEDRYADVSLLLAALEDYLRGSGLTDIADELGRFFAGPVAYEMALKARLVDHLARRGIERLEDDRVRALELFNRVLTLEPEHPEVLAQIDRMSRRGRRGKVLAIFGGLAALAGLAVVAKANFDDRGLGTGGAVAATSADAAPDAPPPPIDAAELLGEVADAGLPDGRAQELPGGRNGHGAGAGHGGATRPPTGQPDSGALSQPTTREIQLTIKAKNAEYRIGNGPWQAVQKRTATVQIPIADEVVIEARSSMFASSQVTVGPGDDKAAVVLSEFKPGRITPICDVEGVLITVDGVSVASGRPRPVLDIEATTGKEVNVRFTAPNNDTDDRTPVVLPGEKVEVTCDF